MNNQRVKIKQALEVLVEAQRHREFQRLAVHLAKRLWPELQATEEQKDGGEDATSFVAGTDGLRRSVAVSLTATLAKIKTDAARIKGRGVALGSLVFFTPVPIDNLTASDWRAAIKKEFGHDVQVISQAEVITLLEQPENRWLCKEYLGLELETDQSLAEIATTVREVAAEILRGWKAVYRYEDSRTIELTLIELPAEAASKLKAEPGRLSVNDMCRLVVRRGGATLVGEPGAGKTFTLIQLADLLLRDAEAPIPVLVPLPVWASSGKDFMAFMETQLAGYKLKSAGLAKLCASGQIALLLNGWNEISDASVEQMGAELKALALHHPVLPMIISTRASQASSPISTESIIHVSPLAHAQKLVIIKKAGLENPSAFITELETNSALATITDTPLFLGISISIARSGEGLPSTRYGILRRFVEHLEKNPEHSAGLKGPPCHGFHQRYLQYIAGKMAESGGTTLSFDEAIAAVAECSKMLQTEGHVENAPNSTAALDCLVRHHILVLPPGLGTSYSFAHQQFQEWFAAELLHRSVAQLANSQNADELFAFQRNILNHRQWKEPLFFLMERLAAGSKNDHVAAAKLVRWSMPVDLLLAAELAGAAGESVWAHVRDELGNALRRWYQVKSAPHRHCALAAMLATGASDFQDILWPLLESGDQNIRLSTCRTWRAFPVACLGKEWRTRFSRWNHERKAEFIREFRWDATQEHLALASDLIKTEDDPSVALASFELLLDAGAYETLTALCGDSRVEDWPDGFIEGILARLPQRYLEPLLVKAKAALPGIESFSARRAVILTLQRVDDPDWPSLVKSEMERLLGNQGYDFQPMNQHPNPMQPEPKPNASPYLAEYLEAITQKDPDWAAGWLANQLTQGRFWWEPFTDYLARMPGPQLQRVADAAVDAGLNVNTARQRAVVLASSRSVVAARILLKAYLAYEANKDEARKEPHYNRGDALKAGIQEIPVAAFVDAVLAETGANIDFNSTRKLLKLATHIPVFQASEDRKEFLRSLVLRMAEQQPDDLKDKGWFRAELVDVLGQVGKSSDAKIIEGWIHDDLRRLNDEKNTQQIKFQEWDAGGRKGPAPERVLPLAFWNSYQRALLQIGGAESANVFVNLLAIPGVLNFAATGLVLFSTERNETANSPFGQRPDYIAVHERQEEKRRGVSTNDSTKCHADAVFAAIEQFLPEFEKTGSRFPRNEIFGAVAALAALNDPRAIPLLSKFASDKYSHWTVTNAFHNLMLKGTLLSGNAVAAILEPVISENETPGWGSNNDNWHMVVQALAVLLFSDDPRIGIARIRKLPEIRLKSHNVRELLVLLGSCRVPEAVDLIVEFAIKPEINEHYLYEVATILSKSPNPDADRGLLALLEKLCSGELNSAHAMEHLPRAIARVAKTGGKIWDEVERRCAKPQSALERHILLHILGEIENYDAAICVCDLMNDEFPMGYPVERLIESAVTQHVPAGGGAHYVKPREATELKRRLANMAYTDVKRRASALQLLGVIGKCRLEHGWPANEPHHPDVELLKQLGTPWALL